MEIPLNFIELPFKWKTIEIFSKRVRPLEILIENKSAYVLKLDSEFFDSGERYESTFGNTISPRSSWLTLVANKSPSAFCGVSGGLKYRLLEHDGCLYLGFTNPWAGSYKCFACLTADEHTAVWAYEQANDGQFKSSSFGGCGVTAEMTDAKYCPSKRVVFRIE